MRLLVGARRVDFVSAAQVYDVVSHVVRQGECIQICRTFLDLVTAEVEPRAEKVESILAALIALFALMTFPIRKLASAAANSVVVRFAPTTSFHGDGVIVDFLPADAAAAHCFRCHDRFLLLALYSAYYVRVRLSSSGGFDVAARLKREKLEQQRKAREVQEMQHKSAAFSSGEFDVEARLKKEKLDQQHRVREAQEMHRGSTGDVAA